MQANYSRSVTMEAACLCGARYERTEETVSNRDFNSAVCQFCGAGLAAWCRCYGAGGEEMAPSSLDQSSMELPHAKAS